MTEAKLLDLIIVITLLIGLRAGWVRGLTIMLSGMAGLVGGLIGGSIAARVVAPVISQKFVYPIVTGAIEATKTVTNSGELAAGTSIAGESLQLFVNGVLEQLHLPTVSLGNLTGSLLQTVGLTAAEIAQAISLRLSQLFTFVVAFLLVQTAVLILFRMLNGVLKLPVIGLPNRLGGAALGCIESGFFVAVVLWALLLLPAVTQSGSILSTSVLSHTILAQPLSQLVVKVLPSVLPL